jgi:predicted Fe-S protein YdhL (DUF1289 family)
MIPLDLLAEPAAWPADREVPSPCNRVCTLDSDGRYCTGCHRTLEEIAGWSRFDAARLLQVWRQIALRRAPSA